MAKELTKNVVLSFYDNEIRFSICQNKSKSADYLIREMKAVQSWFEDMEENIETVTKQKNETDYYVYAKSTEGNIGIASIEEIHSNYAIGIYNEEHIKFSVEEFNTEEEMDNAYNAIKETLCGVEEVWEDDLACVGIDKVSGCTTAIIKIM